MLQTHTVPPGISLKVQCASCLANPSICLWLGIISQSIWSPTCFGQLAPQTADSAISTSGRRLNLFPGKPQGLPLSHLRPPEELCASLDKDVWEIIAKEGESENNHVLRSKGCHKMLLFAWGLLPLSLHCSPAPASSCSLFTQVLSHCRPWPLPLFPA